MTRFGLRTIVPLLAAVVVLPACGGDSNPATSADEAFCNEIEKLDDIDLENDVSSAAEILNDLATKAPDDDVRDALLVIAPIFERLSTADQTDANLMNDIFELMSSEEVTAASEVLDRYGTEVCGFEDSSESTPGESTPGESTP